MQYGETFWFIIVLKNEFAMGDVHMIFPISHICNTSNTFFIYYIVFVEVFYYNQINFIILYNNIRSKMCNFIS